MYVRFREKLMDGSAEIMVREDGSEQDVGDWCATSGAGWVHETNMKGEERVKANGAMRTRPTNLVGGSEMIRRLTVSSQCSGRLRRPSLGPISPRAGCRGCRGRRQGCSGLQSPPPRHRPQEDVEMQ
jgi:hypothetical protein